MKTLPTVTIAAPIRNRAYILNQYLHHLQQIDYPKERINIHFVVNDSVDESLQILLKFKKNYGKEYNKVVIETYNRRVPEDRRISHIRNNYIFEHLSVMRNYILSKVKTDYLFSCDSDILVPENIIRKLLAHDKDIVSGLIFNGYVDHVVHPYESTNLMKYDFHGKLNHVSNYKIMTAKDKNISELLEVDVTGAVILLTSDVCKQAKYGWHFQGEDIYFCNQAKEKGYKIYCDIGAFCSHIMTSK
ncbi:glycosyltransferase [Paenibacillaceae bacterium]|nr:glycosyltransferase [Paenibacillaceae bacterium]